MKRGFGPLSVHSALPMTRRRLDQLSLVVHRKSRKTRAGSRRARQAKQASCSAGVIFSSRRWLRARPKT